MILAEAVLHKHILDTGPHSAQFSSFHAVSGKFGRIIGWCPPPWGWCPALRLVPPLRLVLPVGKSWSLNWLGFSLGVTRTQTHAHSFVDQLRKHYPGFDLYSAIHKAASLGCSMTLPGTIPENLLRNGSGNNVTYRIKSPFCLLFLLFCLGLI